jgi:hypothetical protein
MNDGDCVWHRGAAEDIAVMDAHIAYLLLPYYTLITPILHPYYLHITSLLPPYHILITLI